MGAVIEAFIGRVLASPQHKCLYHFTDTRNLASIQQHGLLSARELRVRGICVPVFGGNTLSLELDSANGMDDYVHVCFLDTHPMDYRAKEEGRIQESRFLKIHPTVMRLPGVLTTNDVANQNGVVPEYAEDMLGKLSLDAVYNNTVWTDPEIKKLRVAARRYEVLVPKHIPLNYISGF